MINFLENTTFFFAIGDDFDSTCGGIKDGPFSGEGDGYEERV